jgi:hypothetical protein
MRAFRWGWTAFVVLATSLPYLFFWSHTPANHHYSWILPPYPEDSLGYMAWSRQALQGNLLFRIKYTALPHKPFFFHPFFLVCGWICAIVGCDIGIVLWTLKALGVILFFAAFYKYLDLLALSPWQFVAASVLVGISSGFGGIFGFLGLPSRWGLRPADLWMPEMSTFWSFLWNPLFPYSLTLIVLIIYWLDRGTRDVRLADMWRSGFATGVLALLHPYALPMLFTYTVIIVFVRRGAEAVSFLFRFFAAGFPFVLYVVLVSLYQPILMKHSARGEMKSPHFIEYVVGFGLPLLICVAALAVHRGPWLKRYWQLLLWFLLCLSFAYLPFWFQRKLIFGAHIPLCILSGVVIGFIFDKIPKTKTHICLTATGTVVLIAILVTTPLYLLQTEAREIQRDATNVYFICDDLLEGLNFLKNQNNPNEVVFATYEASRLIPAFSGNTVVWGHWAMSVDLEERKRWIARVFSPNASWQDSQRSRDFWGTNIQYLFADGILKQSIEHKPELWRVILNDADKVFTNDSVVIYKRRAGQP